MLPQSTITGVRTALLAWYDANRRDLPWRRDSDPYRVWVSEIMLQQTRVDAVLPYYERWLAAFPDVATLANADLHEVLKHWEGLGYYSRARNLHGAARLVREKHGGELPREARALRALPGIGEYTAGAIASIAYNQKTAAIDGNVRRVFCRLFDLVPSATRRIPKYADGLLDPTRPGAFNQAVMDLGATVCTPRAPRCGACPLAALCLARAHATVHKRPAPKRAKTVPHYRVAVLIQLNRDQVVIEQRTPAGLLAGLWQFPEAPEPPREARLLGEVTHTFSHKRITYLVYLAQSLIPLAPHQRWVALHDTASYPMSAAQRRIEKLIALTRARDAITIES